MIEQHTHRNGLTRREFLYKTAAVAVAAVAAGAAREQQGSQEREKKLDWLLHPENYDFYRISATFVPEVEGIHGNTPFLYLQHEDKMRKFVGEFPDFMRGVRAIIDDRFELVRGWYNEEILERIVNYAGILAERGKKIQIDLFDGFRMQQVWNPVYPVRKANSPYVRDGLADFYGEERYKNFFKERAGAIADVLAGLPNLAGVTVANELPFPTDRAGRALFNQWYGEMVPFIADLFPGVPILSGVADPRMLARIPEGLSANTIHLYPFVSDPSILMKETLRSPVPIIVQEIGVPFRLFGINGEWMFPGISDRLKVRYVKDVLAATSVVTGSRVGTAITSVYPWKTDAYPDGYSWDPLIDEETNDLLYSFTSVVELLN